MNLNFKSFLFSYKNIIFFSTVLIFGVSPIYIKFKNKSLEPYPGLILPSGAGRIDMENDNYEYYKLIGVSNNKNKDTIDIQKILFNKVNTNMARKINTMLRKSEEDQYRNDNIAKCESTKVFNSIRESIKMEISYRLTLNGYKDFNIQLLTYKANYNLKEKMLKKIEYAGCEML